MVSEMSVKHSPQVSSIFTFWNLLGLTVTLLYFYWWRRPHRRFPPGPRGVPLMGVIPFLGTSPGTTLKKWSEKYGPVMSARFGRKDVVVLNTFEAINQALVKQSACFSDRPWVQIFTSQTHYLGIAFRRYGETFKAQKHFALKFLRQKGVARRQIDVVINEEGDRFVEFLKTANHGPVDIKKMLYWLTGNIISQTALGKRNDYGDEHFHRLLDTMALLFADPDNGMKLPVVNMFPFAARIFPFKEIADRFNTRMAYILDTMQVYIDEHKKNFDPDNLDDFIDAFIYEQKYNKKRGEHGFTDEQLRVTCRDFFVAGSETSSTTLCWLFIMLMNYPEYEGLIVKEIDEHLGSDGVPSMSMKEDLPMVCAFIQETMRYKTLAPLALDHCTTATTELMGHVIPKDTKVIVNLAGAHMDPKDWPNPEVFDPRRHIDQNGNFVNSNKIIPFSIGTRFCLGESLARAEVFIFFVKLLQKFSFRPANGRPPDVDDEIVTIVTSARSCEVVLKARQ